MNKKQIIQISVIVVCLAVGGYIFYSNFFKAEEVLPPPDPTLTAERLASQAGVNPGQASALSQILPNGEAFNIDETFSNTKFIFGQISYPVLNYNQDVKINENELIIPFREEVSQ